MRNTNLHLTPIEVDIMKLVADGLDNVAISKVLYISRHTVKAHVTAAYKKLEARNRANAVYKAMKCEYIS